jgi:hypothetical protein
MSHYWANCQFKNVEMNLNDGEQKVGENETKTEDRNDDQIWKLWHPHFSNSPKKTSYKKVLNMYIS